MANGSKRGAEGAREVFDGASSILYRGISYYPWLFELIITYSTSFGNFHT